MFLLQLIALRDGNNWESQALEMPKGKCITYNPLIEEFKDLHRNDFGPHLAVYSNRDCNVM
jgi:hypothetical protein